MNKLISENTKKLVALFQSHQIEKAFVFGSAVTDRFNSEKKYLFDFLRMVDARSKIIHGYDEIEPEQIRSIIINHLPILKNEVQKLLSE